MKLCDAHLNTVGNLLFRPSDGNIVEYSSHTISHPCFSDIVVVAIGYFSELQIYERTHSHASCLGSHPFATKSPHSLARDFRSLICLSIFPSSAWITPTTFIGSEASIGVRLTGPVGWEIFIVGSLVSSCDFLYHHFPESHVYSAQLHEHFSAFNAPPEKERPVCQSVTTSCNSSFAKSPHLMKSVSSTNSNPESDDLTFDIADFSIV